MTKLFTVFQLLYHCLRGSHGCQTVDYKCIFSEILITKPRETEAICHSSTNLIKQYSLFIEILN